MLRLYFIFLYRPESSLQYALSSLRTWILSAKFCSDIAFFVKILIIQLTIME